MGYLEREMLLNDTDENGNLLPMEYPCPELGGMVLWVLPAPRGRFLRLGIDLRACNDDEEARNKVFAEFAAEHILDMKTKKPMYSAKELLHAKHIHCKDNDGKPCVYTPFDLFSIIVNRISGLDIDVSKEEAMAKAEEELKKKSE